MEKRLFTSECVTNGHPDKVADSISDAILDACLAQDPGSRVACETMVTTDFCLICGEITTKALDLRGLLSALHLVEKGITSGIGNGLFGPNQPCTRAQIVTFLWRAAGSPVVNYAMNMSDVPEGSYYAEAVRWALSEGITTGTTENTFSPDSECTRAQAVAFLFRYAASEAVTLQELVSGFSDADSVPGYALPAMNWALAEEIVQGNGSKLMPNDSCTRAQIVTFLFRAYQGK